MDLQLARRTSLTYYLEQAVRETNKALSDYKKRTKSIVFYDTRKALFKKNIKEQLRKFYEIYRPPTTNSAKDAAGRVGNECKWTLNSDGDYNISEVSCFYDKKNIWGNATNGWVDLAAKEMESILSELDYNSLRHIGDLDFQVHLRPKKEISISPDFNIPDINLSRIDSINFRF